MTDLLRRPAASGPDGTRTTGPDGPGREPGALGGVPRLWLARAVLAGLSAAGTALVTCLLLALVGWFAAQEGRYGDTRDALRVGADAWLLSLGSGLRLHGAVVHVAPLGLTLLTLLTAHRFARGLPPQEGLRAPLAGAVVMALSAAGLAALTGVLASAEGVAPGALRGTVGAFAVVLAGAAAALVARPLRTAGGGRGPRWLRPVVATTASVALVTVALGAGALAVGLALDLPAAASIYSRMHLHAGDGAMFSLVVLAFVPNAALFSSSYLLGSGFSLGVGTAVSPAATTLGPLPAFPLLVALPGTGPAQTWVEYLVVLPVLGAAAAAWLVQRRRPAASVLAGAWQGLAGGVAAAMVVVLAQLLAGGSAGPGRMSHVAILLGPSLLIALGSLGGGGLLGGLLGAWAHRGRRDEPLDRDDPDRPDQPEQGLDAPRDADDAEPTVELDPRGD